MASNVHSLSKQGLDKRAEKMAEQARPTKAERQQAALKGVKMDAPKVDETPKTPVTPAAQATVPPPSTPAPKAEDQTRKAEDQKSAPASDTPKVPADPAKKKKVSATVVAWRADKSEIPDTATIKILVPGSKRGAAKVRFDLYKDGMTIADYKKATKEGMARTAGQTTQDLKWDRAAKFIDIIIK